MSILVTLGFGLVAQAILSSTSLGGEVRGQTDGAEVKAALTKCLDSDPKKLPALMSELGEPAVAAGFKLLTAPPARATGHTWLSSDESQAIFAGLGTQPSSLRRYLEQNVALEGDGRQRALGLEALKAVASDTDFDLLVALASPVNPGASSPLLNERLRGTVLESLREGRWTLDVVSDDWHALSQGTRRAFTRALGQTDHPAGSKTLAGLLIGRTEADRGLVLMALERAAKRRPVLGGPQTQAAILPLLKSPDADLRRAAIRAAAALHLEGAVPSLVELTEDSAGDAELATDGLHAITDVQLHDVNRWSQWLQDEETWRAQRMPEILAKLSSRDPFLIHASLREIGDHRWGRRMTVAQLSPLLQHKDASVRAATAACLGRLMCPSSTKGLLSLLSDEEPVAAAARAALKAVVGKPLPSDFDDWQSVAVLPVFLD